MSDPEKLRPMHVVCMACRYPVLFTEGNDCAICGLLAERDAALATAREAREERDAATARASALHRRAQRLEGIELVAAKHEKHVLSLRQGHERDVARRVSYQRNRVRFFLARYRAAVEQIRASGTPDHAEGDPCGKCREGRLDVMIGRLVAERDALKAALSEAIARRNDAEIAAHVERVGLDPTFAPKP